MIEMMIGWLDEKIELNNRMIAADEKLSDFDIFLMADNEMMEKIKSELLKHKEVTDD
ncbi:hypothetical protein Javan253_0032 [Streptococcus phage Javan253]|uniref:hypothetical protein n=1 Tax=Streptococcus henryi TaxID=439219 RepID=UPI00037B852C|nr:hypothetical protein [Streptococcus henryi]QBX16488.1 hypothetical protein Javan253_0032 [Streptococcus phage Javan253]